MTATTTKLLDAAEKRMRKGGYNAVSFRDLAEDTGIKSSSVHYHFSRKEDLGIALVERYSERFFNALEKCAARAKTPADKLKAFTRVYRDALVEDDAICLCGLLGAESGGLPHPVADGVQSFFDANIDWVAGALPGRISRTGRRNLASTVLAAHQGAMMLATSMNSIKVFDTITATSTKQALAGG